MTATTNDRISYAAILLRLALGSVWIAHALLKLTVYTLPGFAQWLDGQGLPGFMAWPVFLMEITGGTAIIIGLFGRYASVMLLPILLVATWTHAPNGWLFTNTGGGWEYPVFLMTACLSHALIGDGKFAVSALFTDRIGMMEKPVVASQ